MKKYPSITIVFLIVVILSASSCTTTYLGRYLIHGPKLFDSQMQYPQSRIYAGETGFRFMEDAAAAAKYEDVLAEITYRSGDGWKTEPLHLMLEENDSVAFMVIKDDTIIDEVYFGGSSRESLLPSFSVAKSITSVLLGIALDEGLISGIDVPVQDYLSEFNRVGYEKITIRNLLEMNSGLEHSFGFGLRHDFVKSIFHPDVTELAFDQEVIAQPGETFTYNNYHTVLLGLLLEKVTGMSPSEYLEEKIWKAIGMEYDASWNLSKKDGFEFMASGINASIIDYAKFARLCLREGEWEGRQIVSRDWIIRSTTTDPSLGGPADYYVSEFDEIFTEYFYEKGGYYAWQWWGYNIEDGTCEYYAFGMYGQYLYICPEKNLIIIRMGPDWGDVVWWPDVLKDIAVKFY